MIESAITETDKLVAATLAAAVLQREAGPPSLARASAVYDQMLKRLIEAGLTGRQ